MNKNILRFITSFFVLVIILVSCTKEITEDIFNFKENFFTVQVSADKNAVELQELVNFTLKLQENELPSVYTLDFSTNREGTFRFDSSTFESGQSTTIDAGVHEFSYFPTDEGIHKLSFTVTNANENPRSLTDTFSISVGDVSDLETGFSLVITSSPEEIEVGDLVTINVNIIEEADVPDTATYTIDFGASATGTFVFEGENYIGESQVTVEETQLVFQFTPEEIIEYDLKFSVTSQFDETNVCESAIFMVEAASTEIPVITLNGENPLTLTVGDEYVETATVTDDVDTDIEIVFGGDFDGTTDTVGEFTRTYNATDSDGNVAEEQTRTIIVEASDDLILVESISIVPEQLELLINSEQQLTTTIFPENATNTNLIWTSSDETIATVSDTGMVRGISVGGPIEITVSTTDGSEISTSILVEVLEEVILVEEITIQNGVSPMTVGQEETFTALITPTDASNQSVLWTSSNLDVATVDQNTGLVTAISPGSATISVETLDTSNLEDSLDLVVEPLYVPVQEIILLNDSFSLVEGGTQTIQYSIQPENATNQNVSFFTSVDDDIVTVDENGLVTALAIGITQVHLTITGEQPTASVEVSVEAEQISVGSIEIVSESTEVEVDGTLQLMANILPEDATNTQLLWESNDTSIATVDESTGLVTGISEGNVMITATSVEGITDEIEITVNEPFIFIEEIIVTPNELNLDEGGGDPLFISVLPENATNKSLSVVSSNENAATVGINTFTIPDGSNEFELGVNALVEGSAEITFTAQDGSNVTLSTIVNVIAINTPPVAVIARPGSSTTLGRYVGDSFPFSGAFSSDEDGDTLTYEWYNEENESLGTESSISPIFTTAGDHTVRLVVSDGIATSEDSYTVTVEEVPNAIPVASIDANPISGEIPLVVNFDGSGSTDGDGDTLTYQWFVDGILFNAIEMPSRTFTEAGEYEIELLVSDGNGGTDTEMVTIIATTPNLPPIADLTSDIFEGDAPLTIRLDGSGSSDPENGALSYLYQNSAIWPGTLAPATAITEVTIETPGTYMIGLRVTDAGGLFDDADVITIVVTEPNNKPTIENITIFPTTGTTETEFSFSSDVEDLDGDTLSYSWSDGNTIFGTNSNAIHTFDAPGTYTVTLTASDGQGGTDSFSEDVTVTEPNSSPTAHISTNVISGEAPLTVNFDGSGSSDPNGDTLTYNWNETDIGSFGDQVTTTYTFTEVGTYEVELYVADGRGGDDAGIVTITVTEPTIPVTGVSISRTSVELEVGQSVILSGFVSISPDNATNQNVTWSSGNSSFVSVNSFGVITGVEARLVSTPITVKTVDGEFTASVNVTVVNSDDGGGTCTITAQQICEQMGGTWTGTPTCDCIPCTVTGDPCP